MMKQIRKENRSVSWLLSTAQSICPMGHTWASTLPSTDPDAGARQVKLGRPSACRLSSLSGDTNRSNSYSRSDQLAEIRPSFFVLTGVECRMCGMSAWTGTPCHSNEPLSHHDQISGFNRIFFRANNVHYHRFMKRDQTLEKNASLFLSVQGHLPH